MVNIFYSVMDSPIRPLMLMTTQEGLIKISFENEDFDTVLHTLSTKFNAYMCCDPNKLYLPMKQITEYFNRTRHQFSLDLDYRLSSGFYLRTLHYLPTIPYGTTASYQTIAHDLDSPRAYRAVGTACATNPLPLVIPCHRVTRTNGTLGGYSGSLASKTFLLNHEQHA